MDLVGERVGEAEDGGERPGVGGVRVEGGERWSPQERRVSAAKASPGT